MRSEQRLDGDEIFRVESGEEPKKKKSHTIQDVLVNLITGLTARLPGK